jgi:hypothetical protein
MSPTPSLHLRMETDPVPETSCSLVLLVYQTMDKVQKSSNPECHAQSSELFGKDNIYKCTFREYHQVVCTGRTYVGSQ